MEHRNEEMLSRARALRKNMTGEERRLWFCFLKNYPVRFRRQEIIGGYIADFYCRAAKLVIELDGSQHYSDEGILKDRIRTGRIEERGITVMRIPNG
ncbi:MAG: endonuclease domain-containing protein [Oscillospiraceae bacterium]